MKALKTFSTVTCATLAVFALGIAQAIPISGTLFHVTEPQAQLVNPAQGIPASNVTFSVNPSGVLGLELNFLTVAPDTVLDWLNSSSPAVSPLGGTANGGFNTGDLMDTCVGWPTGGQSDGCVAVSDTGSYVRFQGNTLFTNGQTFTISHDDGIVFLVNGVAIGGFSAGPAAVVSETGTYLGPTGNFPFVIDYAECCGGGANLHVLSTVVPTIPEPATLALLGLGLSGLALVRRRKTH